MLNTWALNQLALNSATISKVVALSATAAMTVSGSGDIYRRRQMDALAEFSVSASGELYPRIAIGSSGTDRIAIYDQSLMSASRGLVGVSTLQINGFLDWPVGRELSATGEFTLTAAFYPYSDIIFGNSDLTLDANEPVLERIRPLSGEASITLLMEQADDWYLSWETSSQLTLTQTAAEMDVEVGGIQYRYLSGSHEFTLIADVSAKAEHFISAAADLTLSKEPVEIQRIRPMEGIFEFIEVLTLVRVQAYAVLEPEPVLLTVTGNTPPLVLEVAAMFPTPVGIHLFANQPAVVRTPNLAGTGGITVTQTGASMDRRRGLFGDEVFRLLDSPVTDFRTGQKFSPLPGYFYLTQDAAQLYGPDDRDDVFSGATGSLMITDVAKLSARISMSASANLVVLDARPADLVVNYNQRADDDRTFVVGEREPAFVVPEEQRTFYVT